MGKGKDTVTSFNSSSDKGILLSEPWELPLYGATIIKDNLRNVNEALASGGPLTAGTCPCYTFSIPCYQRKKAAYPWTSMPSTAPK